MTGPWIVPTPSLPKPRWQSRNKTDADAMVAWVSEHLRVRQAERFNQLYAELIAHGGVEIDENGPARVVHYDYYSALIEAQQGNMAPAQEIMRQRGCPELAPYLQPKRTRGQRRHIPNYALQDAKADVKFTRQLWRQEYGCWRRSLHDNPPSAEDIAEQFHDVVLRPRK